MHIGLMWFSEFIAREQRKQFRICKDEQLKRNWYLSAERRWIKGKYSSPARMNARGFVES
jgi:hypothetical protein